MEDSRVDYLLKYNFKRIDNKNKLSELIKVLKTNNDDINNCLDYIVKCLSDFYFYLHNDLYVRHEYECEGDYIDIALILDEDVIIEYDELRELDLAINEYYLECLTYRIMIDNGCLILKLNFRN